MLGFPKIHYYYRDDEYNALVLNLLGPNLENLLKLCGRRFSVKLLYDLITLLGCYNSDDCCSNDNKN